MKQLLALLLALCFVPAFAETIGPWNLDALAKTPPAEWGAREGLVQQVHYEGEPFGGKPTRVFAYVGRPEGSGPFPAMVLVHGGGGQAFKDWANHWAKRGYVAISMDTAGHGLDKVRLPDGGPEQHDNTKFRAFAEDEAREMWTYHAVAAAIRGHSLLASLPEVDRDRIGVTGLSWGGYLTCIIAGIDHRLKVAVPVYGCGFLADNSAWTAGHFDKMPPEQRERWLRLFDPSSYLAGVRCPILFLNGTNDFAYPLDSYRESYSLVSPELRHVCIKLRMNHGHIWTFGEVDRFADSVLKGGPKPPRFGALEVAGNRVSARVSGAADVANGELLFTSDTGQWQKRTWTAAPATLGEPDAGGTRTISAELPAQRPLVFYLSATEKNGLQATSEHAETDSAAAPK
jgi:dienelactone hydrolase